MLVHKVAEKKKSAGNGKKTNSYLTSTISLNSFKQSGILHLPIPLKETFYMSTNFLKL